MLLERGVDLVTKYALTYAVNEDDPTKLLALGDVHHPIEMRHLNGQFRPVCKAALVIHQFMNVKVHFHVGVPT